MNPISVDCHAVTRTVICICPVFADGSPQLPFTPPTRPIRYTPKCYSQGGENGISRWTVGDASLNTLTTRVDNTSLPFCKNLVVLLHFYPRLDYTVGAYSAVTDDVVYNWLCIWERWRACGWRGY